MFIIKQISNHVKNVNLMKRYFNGNYLSLSFIPKEYIQGKNHHKAQVFQNNMLYKCQYWFSSQFQNQNIGQKQQLQSFQLIKPQQQQQTLINSQTIPSTKNFQVYPIQQYEVGQRLDRYLKSIASINWILIQKYLRNKDIFIYSTTKSQKIKDNDYRLSTNDLLYVKKNKLDQIFEGKKPISLNFEGNQSQKDQQLLEKLNKMIIFDNKNITILNKPSGYSVQGGSNPFMNLFSLMCYRYKKQYIHVTHRLDKPTTGVLFFCKNLKTAQLVQKSIQNRIEYDKYYIALTIGSKIDRNEEYIRCNVQWTNKHKARVVESLQKQQSKDCITYYKKLKFQEFQNKLKDGVEKKYVNLLGLKLLTGRKHQLRCHLSDYLENPIVNDRLYGGTMVKLPNQNSLEEIQEKKTENDQAICLHALMTVIKNKQIVHQVFQIQKEKWEDSIKFPTSSSILSHNANGTIMLKNGSIRVVAKLPGNWKNIDEKINSVKNIFQNEFDEISIGEIIEKSEQNLYKKHKPQKKVITIS